MDIKALIGRLKQAIMLYSAYMENADEHMALISESADALETLRKRLADSEENYEFAMHMANEFKVLAKQRYDAIAAANAEIERLRFALADTEALEIGTGERLAAAQSQIKTLREALQTYIDEHEECQDADDWMAMMCSIEAHHVADEALSLPQDLSALHSYGKRIADEVERRTVERCAKAVWNAKPSQKAIDEIPAAYQLASLSAIRALPLGQIDVEELGK